MTAIEEYQIQQQLTNLLNQFNQQAITNSFQEQNLTVNRGQALGDLSRQFDQQRPFLGVPFARRGLETSGIRNVGIDRSLADQQRTLSRTAQGFDRQLNQISVGNLQNQSAYTRGVSDVDAYRQASRAELASQIRGL